MRGEHFRRCSWCGSVHPEDLVAEPSWHAEWADRKYGWPHKFYVKIPNRDPDRIYCIGSASGPNADREPGFIAQEDLTVSQREIVKQDGMGGRLDDERLQPAAYLFGTKATHFGKFYTVHLADPELPAEARARIEQISGLAFTFTDDGRVGWRSL